MIASALLVPAATSALASAVTSLVTPQPASTPTNAGTSDQASAGRDVHAQPRMQNQKLTSLAQTLLQGAGTFFPSARYNNDTNSEKAKGFVYTVGGAVAEGIGKRLGASGGMAAKLVGTVLVGGGRVAQEYGKDKCGSAASTTNNTGDYNAYSPLTWGGKSTS